MRRAAAILGPTPPFLRWAIQSRCPFLRIGKGSFPESVWRQLRVFKELSAASAEGRIWGDFCLAREASPQEILGFSITEAMRPFGGEEQVHATCRACPSNSAPISLAGCTGLLRLVEQNFPNPQVNPETMAEHFQAVLHVAEQVLSAHDVAQRCQELDRQTSPRWYGLWKGHVLKTAELNLAIDCMNSFQAKGILQVPDCKAMLEAMKFCWQTNSDFHVEFVSGGYSDGIDWVLPPHCKDCRCEWNSAKQDKCPCCGAIGSFAGQRRRRVLGRRPFLELERILGAPAARDLWLEYESNRNARAKKGN